MNTFLYSLFNVSRETTSSSLIRTQINEKTAEFVFAEKPQSPSWLETKIIKADQAYLGLQNPQTPHSKQALKVGGSDSLKSALKLGVNLGLNGAKYLIKEVVSPISATAATCVSKLAKDGYEWVKCKSVSASLNGAAYLMEEVVSPISVTAATCVHSIAKDGHQWVKNNIDPIATSQDSLNFAFVAASTLSCSLKAAMLAADIGAQGAAVVISNAVPCIKASYMLAELGYNNASATLQTLSSAAQDVAAYLGAATDAAQDTEKAHDHSAGNSSPAYFYV
jgi:hypothetical protein